MDSSRSYASSRTYIVWQGVRDAIPPHIAIREEREDQKNRLVLCIVVNTLRTCVTIQPLKGCAVHILQLSFDARTWKGVLRSSFQKIISQTVRVGADVAGYDHLSWLTCGQLLWCSCNWTSSPRPSNEDNRPNFGCWQSSHHHRTWSSGCDPETSHCCTPNVPSYWSLFRECSALQLLDVSDHKSDSVHPATCCTRHRSRCLERDRCNFESCSSYCRLTWELHHDPKTCLSASDMPDWEKFVHPFE